MKLTILSALVLTVFISSAAMAEKVAMKVAAPVAADKCPMVEEAQMSIQSIRTLTSFDEARGYADKSLAMIKDVAQKSGIENYDLQSYNISVNSYDQTGTGSQKTYNTSFSANAMMPSAAKAFDFSTVLEKSGFLVTVSVSATKRCE